MTATLTRERVHAAAWWYCGREQWLEVQLDTRRGGVTDGYTAREFIGAASWEHDGRAYLAQCDADRWLAASGISESDIPVRRRERRPDGYRAVRDAGAAAVVEDDADAAAAFFAGLEDGRWDDDVVPPPVEPPPEIVPVVGAIAAPPRAARVSKAQRREANRALAAQVRALGLIPNGAVWVEAKRLAAAGLPITSETMGEGGITWIPEMV